MSVALDTKPLQTKDKANTASKVDKRNTLKTKDANRAPANDFKAMC